MSDLDRIKTTGPKSEMAYVILENRALYQMLRMSDLCKRIRLIGPTCGLARWIRS